MRKPAFRDAYLALELYDLRRETELRKARTLVGELLSASFDEIRPLLDYGHPQNAHLRQAVSYWEMAASFVMRGILHPDVYLDVRPNFLKRTESVIQEHPAVKGRLMEIRTRLFRARDRRGSEGEESS